MRGRDFKHVNFESNEGQQDGIVNSFHGVVDLNVRDKEVKVT